MRVSAGTKLIGTAIALVLVGSLGITPEIYSDSDGVSTFLYHYFDPPVVYNDGRTPTTLEIVTTGQGIAQVSVTIPWLGTLPMYDDGTHADRVPNDGIYTIDNITIKDMEWTLHFGGTHGVYDPRVTILKRDGTEETVYPMFGLGIVKEGEEFPAVQLGEGLYATEHAFFIVDPSGETLGVLNWPLGDIQCGKATFEATHKLYSVFPDIFDFVVVMPSGTIFDPQWDYKVTVPYFVRAKNEIRNIGIPLFDETAKFGSQGRLRGMIYHSFGTGQVLDHEIGHAWSAYLGQELGLSSGGHWGRYSDVGGQMASYVSHPDVPLGSGHLVDNGDGTWRVEREPGDNMPYSKLDLYVMGLIPPEEVPPVHLLINPDFSDPQRVTAERVETYTIEQLMAAEGGERVPSWRESQKEFNIAFIAVKNKEFTPAEFAFFSLVAKYFTSKEQGDLGLTTFYTATGGRATLNAKLPVEIPGR